MFLNKLLLKEYGKFNNQEIKLAKGINLIYGNRESGKSTLKDFMVAMVYGNGSKNETVSGVDRRPTNGYGYTGKAYINQDDKSYLVERDFSRGSTKTSVMDIMSGREVSLKRKNSLQGTIIDVDKSLYKDSFCISHTEKESSHEISEELNEYMYRLTTSASNEYDVEKAIEKLSVQRDSLSSYEYERKIDKINLDLEDYDDVEDCLRVVKERIDKVDEEFALETARRKREARKLIHTEDGDKFVESEEFNEELDKLTNSSAYLDPELMSEYIPEQKFTDKVWVIILTGIFVIGVISLMVNIMPLTKPVRQVFCLCAVFIVIITIVEGMYEKGYFSNEPPLPSEAEFTRIIYEMERKQEASDVEIDMEFAKEFMEQKSELRIVEAEFLERQDKRNELIAKKNELIAARDGIERERHAITLAINTLNEVSTSIKESLGDILNVGVGDIISRITSGKYTDVRFDNRHRVYVKTEEGFTDFENIRVEDMKQINIAIRIAIAKKLCKDGMPIIFDEAFVGCDKFTIANALTVLSEIKSDQIMILTANEAFKELLDNSGLEYTYNTL